jgi:predicted nucleic acid-binding protein
MYLLDTNIWLERLLAQDQAEMVGQLLDTVPAEQLLMSDFTLHSMGVILGRLGESEVFVRFVQDVLIDGPVALAGLSPAAMQRVVAVMDSHRLDFDDAYQYVVAEREEAVIVSFDNDFDRTELGRQTPEQILAAAGSA